MVQGFDKGTTREKTVSLDGVQFTLRVDRVGDMCLVGFEAEELIYGPYRGNVGRVGGIDVHSSDS